MNKLSRKLVLTAVCALSSVVADAGSFTGPGDCRAAWKRERDRLYSGVTFPVGFRPDGFSWTGFVNRSADGGGGYVLLFREANESSRFSLPLCRWFKGGIANPEVIGGRGSAVLSPDGSVLTVDIPEKLDFVWVKLKPGVNRGDCNSIFKNSK